MSLKDQLFGAGLVSQEDVERVEHQDRDGESSAEARKLAEDKSLRGIANRWQDRLARAEGFEAQMAAANGWIGEIRKSEFRGAFKKEFGEPDLLVLRLSEPAAEKDVRRAEKQLGWQLPASYRDFLLTVGTVAIRTYDWDRMVAIDKLHSETAALRRAAEDIPEHAVAFARQDDSNLLALLPATDGESTLLHYVHDDEDQRDLQSFAEWFAARLDFAIEWFTDQMP